MPAQPPQPPPRSEAGIVSRNQGTAGAPLPGGARPLQAGFSAMGKKSKVRVVQVFTK